MIRTAHHLIRMENGLMIFETTEACPVLISIPHDGLPSPTFSGFFEPRTFGHRIKDLNVWPIARDILAHSHVNAVRGLMPRALIDYNRSWPEGINYYPLTQKEACTALDDDRLAPAYQYYHETIDQILEKSIASFGREGILLIDLHGFSKQPPYAPKEGYDLILGTGNRASIPHGNIDNVLAEYMTSRGYSVFLPGNTYRGPVEDWYSADFTTRHHSEKRGVNVIQIEIAFRFRSREAGELGQKLSQDLAEFIRENFLK